jgi:hypothetical protein
MSWTISVCIEQFVVAGSVLTNTDGNELRPTMFNAKHQYNIFIEIGWVASVTRN